MKKMIYPFDSTCHADFEKIYLYFVDESEKQNSGYVVVGGFYTTLKTLKSIYLGWTRIKSKFHLEPQDELKWNLPSKHPTRQKLDKMRRKTIEVNKEAINFIANNHDLTCLAVANFEKRNKFKIDWRKLLKKRPEPRDFYCESLRYSLQRLEDDVKTFNIRYIFVIVDTPSLGKENIKTKSIIVGTNAAYRCYSQFFYKGLDFTGNNPLKDVGFYNSLLVSNASFNDFLQIADFIVGCTASWIESVITGNKRNLVVPLMKSLKRRFRCKHGNPGMFGDGFVLWPKDPDLWSRLIHSLQ